MVRFCKRQASIKAVESALENNVAVQAITDALGVDDNDGSDDADEDTSLDEEDLNEGLTTGRSNKNFECHIARLSGDPVFQNNSNNPQQSVQEQMMVTLKRLGCYGNSVSLGFGTVELYTNWCLMAILGIKGNMLKWPDADAWKVTQQHYAKEGFDGCVGLINGSLIPIFDAPTKNGSDCCSRKGFCVIATLLICDTNRNIIYIHSGWPGYQVLNPGVHVPESDSQPTNDAPTQRATLAGRRHCGKITAQALAFNQ
ncbi:hypothetical protein PSTT_07270 [Puccinia striiformis]|uniref:DDE Tnp4 domain-containing protein n=1 Tax=Puccinia striiformis TaxID=27350 RepID=A0A2S4VGT7_9BASI|nr:hypothetical protein PSTT_07270 [Puccinia striiformis]